MRAVGFIHKLYSEITEVPQLLQVSQIPSLNGLRTVSIIFVLVCHSIALSTNPLLQKFITLGNLGVYVFFVISGFLITTLLIKEKLKNGTISLTKFYKRRFLRIIPLAYIYPLLLLILNSVLDLHISAMSFAGSFLFLANLGYFQRERLLGHYWSLSVEEQFYLIFPLILKRSFKWYLNFLFGLFLILLILRNIDFITIKSSFPRLYRLEYLKELVNNFDGIIIGSLLSILTFKNMLPLQFIKRYKLLINLISIPLIIVIHCKFIYLVYGLNTVLTSILIAIVLISNVMVSNDFIYKFLNKKLVNYIGMMSFSIYIWQQLFTYPGEQLWAGLSKYASSMIINLPLLALTAYLSYNYFEKTFLKFKSKI